MKKIEGRPKSRRRKTHVKKEAEVRPEEGSSVEEKPKKRNFAEICQASPAAIAFSTIRRGDRFHNQQ